MQAKNEELKEIVVRLTVEKRVADVMVTSQQTLNGQTQTTLLFVEVGRNGVNLPPKSFTIQGSEVHIDAMLIKFDHHFVEEGDPLRGQCHVAHATANPPVAVRRRLYQADVAQPTKGIGHGVNHPSLTGLRRKGSRADLGGLLPQAGLTVLAKTPRTTSLTSLALLEGPST